MRQSFAIASIMPVLAMLPAAVLAQDTDILKSAINQPDANYTAYGPDQTSKVIKDPAVQGGEAVRIEVKAKGAQVYTTGATSPIAKPIAKGDRLVVAFWARAPRLRGDQTTPIPFFGIGEAQEPYTQVVVGSAQVGKDWKMYEARGVAKADYPVGRVNVALHLSAEKAVFDLGPVFVLDLRATR